MRFATPERYSGWQAGAMSQPPDPTVVDEELRSRLTPLQYQVTQCSATERAFSGEYWNTKDPGVYHCVVCDIALFDSETKYDSGTGWPSFWAPVAAGAVGFHEDRSYGMVRIEAVCGNCGAHLGHLFPDGPRPTGERYCMNSASLRLERRSTDPTDAASSDAAPSQEA